MSVTIEQLTEQEIKARGITNWPIWTKEISRFPWFYDSTERCLFLEGDVTIETPGGTFQVQKGDFVTFRKGLECVWDIKVPVRKHYDFE